MTLDLHQPWLLAVWPGMGNVALEAGTHLIGQLGAELLEEMPAEGHFDIEQIDIKEGVAQPAAFPRSRFFGWKNPRGGRDLVIFVGEAQPAHRGYEFCSRLMERALRLGVDRLYTFAAMATPTMHPTHDPRVFAAVNRKGLLPEVERDDVELLRDGQITGMNGVILAAAADRGLDGICFLGELPYFAVAVPNPKASMAVLRIFMDMGGFDFSLESLARKAKAVERGLVELIERMRHATSDSEDEEAEGEFSGFVVQEEDDEEPEPEHTLSPQARQKIERLFRAARVDRSKAMELKDYLDRQGVFKDYEDRFLDLFKQGQ